MSAYKGRFSSILISFSFYFISFGFSVWSLIFNYVYGFIHIYRVDSCLFSLVQSKVFVKNKYTINLWCTCYVFVMSSIFYFFKFSIYGTFMITFLSIIVKVTYSVLSQTSFSKIIPNFPFDVPYVLLGVSSLWLTLWHVLIVVYNLNISFLPL